MLSKLGNGTSSNRLLAFDDPSDASCDVRVGRLSFRSLVHSDDQVGYDVGGDLHVCFHKRREEAEDGVERHSGYQRRVRDGVDVFEEFLFNLWECRCRGELKKK